jgi:RNA polymerase sigma factor (sigma-70 family)
MRSDLELLERWRGGDVDAGNELFDRHYRSVLRVFRHKAAPVEDLVQRTFLACVEGQHRIANPASFRHYLLRTARNELLMHLRKSAVRGHDLDTGVTSLAELQTSPGSRIDRERTRSLLLEALRQIPLDYQFALELYYWEGLSGPDLAEALDVPEGTARSRLRLGKQMLRRELDALAKQPSDVPASEDDFDRWAREVKESFEPSDED